jgi:hypothetical protein
MFILECDGELRTLTQTILGRVKLTIETIKMEKMHITAVVEAQNLESFDWQVAVKNSESSSDRGSGKTM